MEDTNAAKIMAQLDSMTAYIKELEKKQDEIVTLLKNDVEEIKEEINVHSTALGDHNDRIEALETKVSSLMNRKTGEEKDDWEIIRDKENARRKKESFFIGKDQKSEQGAGGSSFADILKKNLREDASKVLSKNKFQLDYSRNKDDFFIESRKIVGLKPVTKANIDYFISEEVSREQAEVLAAEEYLTHFLQLDREEISKLNISSTKCNKANTILYITTSEDSVIDLFRKGSKARNKNFQLVNFIPPQIYARYTAAQEVCKKLREKYENEYFTVRINRNDVDIKYKTKDEIDWKNLDMDYKDDLPEIDYTKVWSGLTRDIERKEFEEFSPNKEGRKSDALFTTDDEQKGSSSKRKEVTPIKESEQPKNKK